MRIGYFRPAGSASAALRALGLLMALALLASVLSGCEEEAVGVTEAERERVVEELQDRSFRQFDPHVDGDPRKGVILDFYGGISLWAQFAEGPYAVKEWEILADSYTVEARGSEYTLRFINPGSRQQIPTECEDCIPAEGVSISVRDPFDEGSIAFRVNDPDGVLPLPFPVFESWTRFSEDEYVN